MSSTTQTLLGGMLTTAAVMFVLAAPVSAAPVLINDVPAYDWYHGCGPTAAGSILGYWDLHGYDGLFDASGWDAVKLTANVQDHISSAAHNAKYDPDPDVADSVLPVPTYTSIADWFQTSVNLPYGWSYLSDSDDAFEGFANYRGYSFDAWYAAATWAGLTSSIDAGRPVMFLVDSSGDGGTDHFVPVFGYDFNDQGQPLYGFYDTWSEAETVRWEIFRGMSDTYTWGVGYATYVAPLSDPIPEPATLALLGIGIVGLVAHRRRRRV